MVPEGVSAAGILACESERNRRGKIYAASPRRRRRDVNAALSRRTCATARARAPTPAERSLARMQHTPE